MWVCTFQAITSNYYLHVDYQKCNKIKVGLLPAQYTCTLLTYNDVAILATAYLCLPLVQN